jgi:AraC-like DNA-binding protein
MSSVLLALPGPDEVDGGLWYSTPASTRFGRHHHQELELNVLVTGEAHYSFPDRQLRVVAPATLWIPPFVEHELIHVSHDLSMWVHSFRALGTQAAPSQPAGASHELESSVRAALHELSDGPRVAGIPAFALAQVCARSREGLMRPGLREFNGILLQIFRLAWSARGPADPRGEALACHPGALYAARLLQEPDTSGSMEALARSAALSRERLSRVFAHCFGIGLVQYRNHHRVQRFIHDYGYGTQANMLRAALEVGFGSYVQFHRAFKQVVGYPPALHLERVKEGIIDPERTGNTALHVSSMS